MNIVNKRKNMVLFKNLSCGEVFKDDSNYYMMKIEFNNNANVVYLFDGSLGSVDDEEMFERVDCELVVSD